jgi:uncharacterized protein
MSRITLGLATMLSFMAFSPVAAQDLQKGLDAFNAGDYATALQEFRPLAEQGNAKAQWKVGFMYETGNGVPQDYAEAVKWMRLAAVQGHVIAQYNLGEIYKNGKGVLQDNVIAHMWYNLAAANGLGLSRESRNLIAESMTPAAIEKAQAMARECMSSGYTKCGD